jgi:hypothetical protein
MLPFKKHIIHVIINGLIFVSTFSIENIGVGIGIGIGIDSKIGPLRLSYRRKPVSSDRNPPEKMDSVPLSGSRNDGMPSIYQF